MKTLSFNPDSPESPYELRETGTSRSSFGSPQQALCVVLDEKEDVLLPVKAGSTWLLAYRSIHVPSPELDVKWGDKYAIANDELEALSLAINEELTRRSEEAVQQ